jgi:glycosyltransferase involved in cell wall biosynthesis
MKRTHVLWVTDYEHTDGGAQLLALRFIEATRELFEWSGCVPCRGLASRWLGARGLPVHFMRKGTPLLAFPLAKYLRNVDVAYVDTESYVTALRSVSPVPIVWHVHHATRMRDDHRAERVASVVVTVSRAVHRRLVHPEKAIRLLNAVPSESLESFESRVRKNASGDRPIVLSVGRLSEQKGADLLVRAIAGLPCDLWWVGPASTQERRRVERLASDHGIRATYWGSQTDVVSFYERADIFVQPSQSEGLSLALLEAMTAGLPCVATNIPGNGEVLGDAGRLVSQDPHALHVALAELLGDASLRACLGAEARLRVAHFSWPLYVEGLRGVIEQASREGNVQGDLAPNRTRSSAIRLLRRRGGLGRTIAGTLRSGHVRRRLP